MDESFANGEKKKTYDRMESNEKIPQEREYFQPYIWCVYALWKIACTGIALYGLKQNIIVAMGLFLDITWNKRV